MAQEIGASRILEVGCGIGRRRIEAARAAAEAAGEMILFPVSITIRILVGRVGGKRSAV